MSHQPRHPRISSPLRAGRCTPTSVHTWQRHLQNALTAGFELSHTSQSCSARQFAIAFRVQLLNRESLAGRPDRTRQLWAKRKGHPRRTVYWLSNTRCCFGPKLLEKRFAGNSSPRTGLLRAWHHALAIPGCWALAFDASKQRHHPRLLRQRVRVDGDPLDPDVGQGHVIRVGGRLQAFGQGHMSVGAATGSNSHHHPSRARLLHGIEHFEAVDDSAEDCVLACVMRVRAKP